MATQITSSTPSKIEASPVLIAARSSSSTRLALSPDMVMVASTVVYVLVVGERVGALVGERVGIGIGT